MDAKHQNRLQILLILVPRSCLDWVVLIVLSQSIGFFLKLSKKKENTIGFQCFILGEKLYLRSRLHLMLFVFFFSFLPWDPHQIPYLPLTVLTLLLNKMEKYVNLAETDCLVLCDHPYCSQVFTIWAFTSPSEHAFCFRICPIKCIVFFLKRGFWPPRRISEKSKTLDHGEGTAGALGTFSGFSPTMWRPSH